MPSSVINGQQELVTANMESEEDLNNDSLSPTGRVTRSSSRIREVKAKDTEPSVLSKISGQGKKKSPQSLPSNSELSEPSFHEKNEKSRTPRNNANAQKINNQQEKGDIAAAPVRKRASTKSPKTISAVDQNVEEAEYNTVESSNQISDTVAVPVHPSEKTANGNISAVQSNHAEQIASGGSATNGDSLPNADVDMSTGDLLDSSSTINSVRYTQKNGRSEKAFSICKLNCISDSISIRSGPGSST
jgi:hypothetical protein